MEAYANAAILKGITQWKMQCRNFDKKTIRTILRSVNVSRLRNGHFCTGLYQTLSSGNKEFAVLTVRTNPGSQEANKVAMYNLALFGGRPFKIKCMNRSGVY